MPEKVIIIGSGLGGLSCGVILARYGYDVTVLEQGTQMGGCLQCFVRDGVKFETGMHFVGSAAEGQTLDRLMRFLELKKDIRLQELDRDGYDVVSLGGRQYRTAVGREAFITQMADYFPHQRTQLERYYDLIEEVAKGSSLRSLRHADFEVAIKPEHLLRSVNEVIDSVITDPLLAKVLVGNLPLYAAERDKTPFATHAFITDFYNRSAFRFIGGSDTVAASLIRTIKRHGGQVRTHCRVVQIVCDESRATAVQLASGEVIPADIVISSAHPKRTLELLDTKLIRPAFRRRVNAIPQTVGAFSVHLRFKPGCMPYMNHNFYAYNGDTPWNCEQYDRNSWPKGYLYMHLCHKPHPRHAESGVIISYMQMADVERWADTRVGRRGADYEQFKREKAERLIDAVAKDFPSIREQIDGYYTSTPLTYRDYTGTEDGGLYGIAKNVKKNAEYRVSQRTKVPNVLLTGQNINAHGMLGVIIGAIVTCSALIPAETIYQQIMEAD